MSIGFRGLIGLTFALLAGAFVCCGHALAGDPIYNRSRPVFGMDLGLSSLRHYDLSPTPGRQPPPSWSVPMRANLFLGKNFIPYLVFAPGILSPGNMGFGLGGRIRFWSFGGTAQHAVLPELVNTYVDFDIYHYQTAPPMPGDTYAQEATLLRFGGSLMVPFSKTLYLDFTSYLFRYSRAFMIMPSLSIGYVFGSR